ncbi:MAG: superoxide dismutase [Clostridium sp.]
MKFFKKSFFILFVFFTAMNLFSIKTFAKESSYQFTLPPLPYSYNALEPYIDETTMILHHDKHHKAYVDKLNVALKNHPKLHDKSLEELLSNIDKLPKEIQTAVRNNGGGHYNHSFFWNVITDKKTTIENKSLLKAINRDFGSFDNFKNKFKKASLETFGSGWVWLFKNADGKLIIYSTPNQDNHLILKNKLSTDTLTPIIALDLWEHAYYLKYQNRRDEYIDNFWNIVNWDSAEIIYNSSL